jgi:GNAT superfamily N-acetyltransferase/AraC-like DNA-binding protein
MPSPIPVTDRFSDSDKVEVRYLFNNGATQQEIAEKFGVSRRTIMKLCNILGLSRSASDAGHIGVKSDLDKPDILKAISDLRGSGKSLSEIALSVGRSTSAISRLCANHAIIQPPKPYNYTKIAAEYQAGNTLTELSKKYSISVESIDRKLNRMGVKLRAPIMKFNGHRKHDVPLNKDEIAADYLKLGSLSKTAEKHDCTMTYVRTILESRGIVIRTTSEIMSGEGNPFFGKKHPEEIAKYCAEIGSISGRVFWEQNPDYAVIVSQKQKELWLDLEKRKADSELISRLRQEGKCNSYKGAIHTRFGQIQFDSSYELAFIEKCDSDRRIVHLERDFALVEYDYNGIHIFIPDFRIWLENGDFLIIEMKSIWLAKQPKELEKIKAGFDTFLDKFFVLDNSNLDELSDRLSAILQPTEFNFNDLIVLEVSKADYLRFYGCFHYLGRTGRHGFTIGAYLYDRLIACATIGSITRNEIAKKQNVLPSQIRELARFCIHPDYHKHNFASWLLSKVTATYRKQHPEVLKFVAFADTTVGHIGTMYKAAGWKLDGSTKASYHYEDKSGKIIHKKTVWDSAKNKSITEDQYAISEHYMKVKESPKNRFTYNID